MGERVSTRRRRLVTKGDGIDDAYAQESSDPRLDRAQHADGFGESRFDRERVGVLRWIDGRRALDTHRWTQERRGTGGRQRLRGGDCRPIDGWQRADSLRPVVLDAAELQLTGCEPGDRERVGAAGRDGAQPKKQP